MTSLSTMKASPICPTVGTSSAQRSRPSLGHPQTPGIVAQSAAAQDVGFLLPLVVAEELRNPNKSCSQFVFRPRLDPIHVPFQSQPRSCLQSELVQSKSPGLS